MPREREPPRERERDLLHRYTHLRHSRSLTKDESLEDNATLDSVAFDCHLVFVASDVPVYGIDELAERAGVTRRTVRYYVQRGLLPAPTGVGRGKHYTAQHLASLSQIRELQEADVPLEEIATRLHGLQAAPSVPTPAPLPQTTWTRIALADGLELHVRGRRFSEPQLRALRNAITQVVEGGTP